MPAAGIADDEVATWAAPAVCSDYQMGPIQGLLVAMVRRCDALRWHRAVLDTSADSKEALVALEPIADFCQEPAATSSVVTR